MDDVVLVCLKPNGCRVFIEPRPIASVEEDEKMLRPGEHKIATIVTASGGQHVVLDDDRQVGERWVKAKFSRVEIVSGQ